MTLPGPEGSIYLDACASSPPAASVLEVMAAAQATAWANPSSLHGYGLAAADLLERSRQAIASSLSAHDDQVVFCSGGTEAAHLALAGAAAGLAPGRLVISAVEHPAVDAAAHSLVRQGWTVVPCPVDVVGRVKIEALEALLKPPTRLVSVIWGQSEVGTLQPIERIGSLCRQAGVIFHTDAVQVVGHQLIDFSALPVDLLSFTAHKLQGPRGIGVLLARRDLSLQPLLQGGGQEGGLRAGTESVVLAAGLAEALALCQRRLLENGGLDPLQIQREQLGRALQRIPGVAISGCPRHRLPHHLSLLVDDGAGQPLPGRRLVQALWRQGFAVSSGTACHQGQAGASPVLAAMGLAPAAAASGLRISLGPWLRGSDLAGVPQALAAAQAEVAAERRSDRSTD
ncbi:aminotransferase class V-fold PLP-dependent enzyme [Synechococcus sp. CS-1325]|uniref:cysteine desulfurase family protein n=1 Tax=unclassified Synechococcus TaxID=2626047 RepID=UPI000DB4028A|nr:MULTISPECIES: aminotransferase class V-fold PLP-dependent enzyme [unclassified Synechococcus]MCT0199379.1 aminotransferase class V-fold PLP-dependent enzyme [Synechococcus sp. CS-1325]MCT0214436.1 aminotransferase class V-fold PLP-dependent enzyme [Synechococcus sp. CS-1326]MCT0233261.1 aminotransferase class V-fold PLP-dependent enzyme [Synechococcus sp. CS-1327]PZV02995.1 MAG: cysteine desulfurase [Cyanobium sp.]